MSEEYEPRRAAGSRIGVLVVGFLVGAVVITAMWVAVAGNPLSDTNEVVYLPITVASLNESRDTICWSENPLRRDALHSCAILALDPKARVPQVGDEVTVGVVTLQPPGATEARHVVYVAATREPASASPEPSPSD